jgi:hypothetical protein
MGIVFIGMFLLAAGLLTMRALRVREGKAVPLALTTLLVAVQVVQILSYVVNGAFLFGTLEHFVISALLVAATVHNFATHKSMQYI